MVLETLIYEVKINKGNSDKTLTKINASLESIVKKATKLTQVLDEIGSSTGINRLNDSLKETNTITKEVLSNMSSLASQVSKMKGVNIKVRATGTTGGATPPGGALVPYGSPGRYDVVRMGGNLTTPPGGGASGSTNVNRRGQLLLGGPERSDPYAFKVPGAFDADIYNKSLKSTFGAFAVLTGSIMGVARSFSGLMKVGNDYHEMQQSLIAKQQTYFTQSAQVREEMPGATRDTLNAEQAMGLLNQRIKELNEEGNQMMTANALKGVVAQMASVGVSLDYMLKDTSYLRQIQSFAVAKYGSKSMTLSENEMLNIGATLGRAYTGRAGALKASGIQLSPEEVKMLNNPAIKFDDKTLILMKALEKNTANLDSNMIENNKKQVEAVLRADKRAEQLSATTMKIQQAINTARNDIVMPVGERLLRTFTQAFDLDFKDGINLSDKAIAQMASGIAGVSAFGIGSMIGLAFAPIFPLAPLIGGLVATTIPALIMAFELLKVEAWNLANGFKTVLPKWIVRFFQDKEDINVGKDEGLFARYMGGLAKNNAQMTWNPMYAFREMMGIDHDPFVRNMPTRDLNALTEQNVKDIANQYTVTGDTRVQIFTEVPEDKLKLILDEKLNTNKTIENIKMGFGTNLSFDY